MSGPPLNSFALHSDVQDTLAVREASSLLGEFDEDYDVLVSSTMRN